MPTNDLTANLALPLPHVDNALEYDVARLRSALTAIDAAVFGKATPADITAAINAVLDGAPAALDTLNELAAAIADDASYAASITSALAGKAATVHTHAISDVVGLVAALAAKLETVPVATGSVVGGVKDGAGVTIAGDGTLSLDMASGSTLGGIKIGVGLSIDGAGVVSASGGGASNTFTELSITPTAGQTVFTPAGGYTVDQIEIFKNGVLLYGAGDDYTATNGTTFTTTVPCQTTDTLLLRKWAVLALSGAVAKAGDNMTGNLGFTRVDKGTVGTGTATFDVQAAGVQRLQVSGALTIAFSNWPATGIKSGVLLQLVNAGSAAVTLPTINWIKPDGTVTTSFSTYLTAISRPALQTSGTDFAVVWSLDGGATLYGKLV